METDVLTVYAPEHGHRSVIVYQGLREYRFWFDSLDDLHDTLEAACRFRGLLPSSCTAALMDAKRGIEDEFFSRPADGSERNPPAVFAYALQWFSAWALVGLAAGVLLWGLRQ